MDAEILGDSERSKSITCVAAQNRNVSNRAGAPRSATVYPSSRAPNRVRGHPHFAIVEAGGDDGGEAARNGPAGSQCFDGGFTAVAKSSTAAVELIAKRIC